MILFFWTLNLCFSCLRMFTYGYIHHNYIVTRKTLSYGSADCDSNFAFRLCFFMSVEMKLLETVKRQNLFVCELRSVGRYNSKDVDGPARFVRPWKIIRLSRYPAVAYCLVTGTDRLARSVSLFFNVAETRSHAGAVHGYDQWPRSPINNITLSGSPLFGTHPILNLVITVILSFDRREDSVKNWFRFTLDLYESWPWPDLNSHTIRRHWPHEFNVCDTLAPSAPPNVCFITLISCTIFDLFLFAVPAQAKKLFRRRNLVRQSRCLIDAKKTVLPAVDEVQEPPDSMAARLRDDDPGRDQAGDDYDDDDNAEFFFDSIESSLATSAASSRRLPPECDSIDLSQPDTSLPTSHATCWPQIVPAKIFFF